MSRRQQFELLLSTPSIQKRDRRQEAGEGVGEHGAKDNPDISTGFVLLPNEPFQKIQFQHIHFESVELRKIRFQKVFDSDISSGFVRLLPNEPDCALFTNTITRAFRDGTRIQIADVKSIVMK